MQLDKMIEELKHSGWTFELAKLFAENILQYKDLGRNVVFDFDNTVICGDIGEKVLHHFSDDYYQFKESHKGFSPVFHFNDELITLEAKGALNYYNHFLSYSALNFNNDLYYKSIPYAWAVQIMEGLTLKDLLGITEKVFPAFSQLDVEGIKPFIYPAILKLIELLQNNGFECRFITASNVWSVRKIILEVINPILSKEGVSHLVSPDSVIGLEVLLQHKTSHELRKDQQLVNVEDYTEMIKAEGDQWLLTPNLNFPVTAYDGKVAAYHKHFGMTQPLFCFGDTTSDINLLAIAEHPVWIARLENPDESEKVWNGWSGKTFIRERIQPIDSEHHCKFLDWETLKNKDFSDTHPMKDRLLESLRLINR